METIIGLCALGSAAYLLARPARAAFRRATEAFRSPPATPIVSLRDRQRRLHAYQSARLQQLLQAAFRQLLQAQDFRRAANFASHASRLPAGVRHRLFRAYRPLFVQHYARRMAAGTDANLLLGSLRELLTHLGIPAFEADYLRAEAERRLPRPQERAAVPFAQRVTQLQREHDERIAALQQMDHLDEETRQELVEAEHNRHRDALRALGDGEPEANRP